MRISSYSYSQNLGKISFTEAEQRVTAALKSEGFGILTTIDVKETLKQKLGVDFRPYKILGACNPPLAYRALTTELLTGLFLPCNVVLYQENEGQIMVSIAKPQAMFQPVQNNELLPLLREIDDKLRKVLKQLSEEQHA
jgi:uncharacterized protein (DUF302 family)